MAKVVTGHAQAYLRVSTGEQAQSGLGLEAQRAAIDQAAKRLGLKLVAAHVDAGVSGGLPAMERAAFMDCMAQLKPGDVILVAKRDRLGRDVYDTMFTERRLQKQKVRIVSAAGEGTESDEPQQMLMRHMIDALSQYERSMISSRTKAALRAKRDRGERAGNVPWGWKLPAEGKLLEPCVEEREITALAVRHRDAGLTVRGVVEQLRRDGVVSPRTSKPLALHQVARLLTVHAGSRSGPSDA